MKSPATKMEKISTYDEISPYEETFNEKRGL